MRKTVLALTLCFAAFSLGCTHGLHVSNTDEYFAPPAFPVKKPLKLGVTSASATDVNNNRYIASIIDALQRSGNFERIIYPFNSAIHQGEAEVLADINVNPRYSGSWSNLFVNFPGYIIFAPAIWGYKYTAELETQVVLTRLPESPSQQLSIPTRYSFRHAAINRTWTEVGWLEIGLIPLIGGFVFTDYDPAVTGEFITQVGSNYGAFVARKIIEALPPGSPQPAAITGMVTP